MTTAVAMPNASIRFARRATRALQSVFLPRRLARKLVREFIQDVCMNRLLDVEACKQRTAELYKKVGVYRAQGLLQSQGVYQILNRQFVNMLADKIAEIDPKSTVEIGAGMGWLTYHLNARLEELGSSVRVKATDLHSRNVAEGLSHTEAIEEHKPDLVILSWPSSCFGAAPRIDVESLEAESVKHMIFIGEFPGGTSCTGSEDLRDVFSSDKYAVFDLENPGRPIREADIEGLPFERRLANSCCVSTIDINHGEARTWAFLISKLPQYLPM